MRSAALCRGLGCGRAIPTAAVGLRGGFAGMPERRGTNRAASRDDISSHLPTLPN